MTARIKEIKYPTFQDSERRGCVNHMLTFEVEGDCRGCEDQTALLDIDNSDEKKKIRHLTEMTGTQPVQQWSSNTNDSM